MLKLVYNNTKMLPDVLHIGCGSDVMENAVNLDINIPGFGNILFPITKDNIVIVEGEITSPQDFPKKHFKRIEAHMVLEHVHPDLIPNLLYCLSNFLQDNGVIVATVPNFAHLAECITAIGKQNLSLLTYSKLREVTNEFMCPNMCSMGGHQSIWIKSVAEMWLNAEGFKLVSWQPSYNMMHVTFNAVKVGGDHVSPVT